MLISLKMRLVNSIKIPIILPTHQTLLVLLPKWAKDILISVTTSLAAMSEGYIVQGWCSRTPSLPKTETRFDKLSLIVTFRFSCPVGATCEKVGHRQALFFLTQLIVSYPYSKKQLSSLPFFYSW